MSNLSWRIPWVCLVSAFLWVNCARAQHDHSSGEFEVFVAAEAFHGSNHTRSNDADPWVDADVVFGITQHQFRVFGEYYATPDEHDLERFHQPASAWNTEHHHGQYLQTDITRPYIERWEDEQGVIPQHITGALFESRQSIGKDGAIQISAGVGAGPALTNGSLDAIDLIGSNPGRHRLSVTGRLAYLPEYVGPSSVGLMFGHDDLAASGGRLLPSLRS